jgi:hypothetical protein
MDVLSPPANNLLLALYTYAHQQDENFTTEAFVHLLRYLQFHEPRQASILIAALTRGLVAVTAEEVCELAITTQKHFSTGTPDILISGCQYYVFVEVKAESDPGWDQFDKYRALLSKRSEPHKYLVLLSRYAVQPDEVKKADEHVRWHGIAQVLGQNVAQVTDPISLFLIQQFLAFLRERRMAMERVGWELVRGVQSLMNLVSMLEEATQSSNQIEKTKVQAGAGWNGFYLTLNATQYWLGAYYSKPYVLVFEAYNVAKDPAQKAGVGRLLDKGAPDDFGRFEKQSKTFKWVNELDLQSEHVHFFALSSENQQKIVEEFVTNSISAVMRFSPIAATVDPAP